MQIVVSINRYNHIIMFKNTVSGALARALGITALVLMSLSCSGPESGRIVIPFDRDWKFHLDDIHKGVTTRSRVAHFCEHYSFVSSIEPFRVEEALLDPDWVLAMKRSSITSREMKFGH